MKKLLRSFLFILLIAVLVFPSFGPTHSAQAQAPITFTILHTNDFHGQLEPVGGSSPNPGAARLAQVIETIRAAKGPANVVLLDGGDEMQGSLLSNLQQGAPTIDVFNAMGYDAAVFGNHEFDWGQAVLEARKVQASYPFLAANVVAAASCPTGEWNSTFANPYVVLEVGTAPNVVRLGVIGITSVETPYITIASATAGLCFKDPVESILRYYDEVDAASDVIVVLSHSGISDGGYGYGIPVLGDQTIAQRLINAGKPVPLIIGGHSHTDVTTPMVVGGVTTIVQAHYNGRKVGQADITYTPGTGAVAVTWTRNVVAMDGAMYGPVNDLITAAASNPDYVALINQEIGYTNVNIARNYNGDSLMGAFIQDALYYDLNEGDADPGNDVDIVFNNPGGLRADIGTAGSPMDNIITYGELFSVLPFGNQTVVGEMAGAQILDLLNQSASLFKGAIQVAGIKFKFYHYNVAGVVTDYANVWAWGAYDAQVWDKATSQWLPLDLNKTYRIATNEFLAPAGQDGFVQFKYVTNISYWGDMLLSVIDAVHTRYPDADHPYNGVLDGRIEQVGTFANGPIIPVTILHHNDSHGRLLKSGTYQGLTQLAALIQQERNRNPGRTLLVNLGDQIQGDSMMYFFKNAGLGYAADGTVLDPALRINPMIAAMNSLNYDAMVLGNHEFNFGSQTFTSVFSQAAFSLLGANLTDSGEYGINKAGIWNPLAPPATDPAKVNVYDGKVIQLPGLDADHPLTIGLVGLTNHRVPNYELPSNIQGLSFSNPIDKAAELVPVLDPVSDAVVALTHIGFTTVPGSVEVDNNVDTYLAATVPGIDAIIGGHSHTNPASGQAPHRFLPAMVIGSGGNPVLINQAYRYNTYLGEVVLGFLPVEGGGYQLVTKAGRDIPVSATSTPEDAALVSLLTPYKTLQDAYNATVVGQTTAPINTMSAFTQETNGANLQADASVWELETNLPTVDVDVHLSGAMTNSSIAAGATPAAPYTLTVANMFTAMPYENSLLVLRMNGPQIKRVLERAYRNYFYYKYISGYGGYSYYTTCMIDTDTTGRITYDDTYPQLPNENNVLSFTINGVPVDFADADTYYNVSTVNYLAAGSCNFNDNGVSLWLDGPTIVTDTQFYVRDAVINYIKAHTPVSPAIEGRLIFDPLTVAAPVVTPEPSLEGAAISATASFTGTVPDYPPYTCTVDYGDGTGPMTGVVANGVCTGPAHTYTAFGTYNVKIRVTGRTGAYGENSVAHKVSFDWEGFYPPLKNAPALFKAIPGITIPVKFSLAGDKSTAIFQAGYPMIEQVDCSTLAAIGAPVFVSGNLMYDPSIDQYNFLWKTKKSLANTCQMLTIGLVDGTDHVAYVSFTK